MGKDYAAIFTVIIPNDHGADDRPEAGYPFRRAIWPIMIWLLVELLNIYLIRPIGKNVNSYYRDDAQNGLILSMHIEAF
jgi:hypothetical protein